MRELRHQRAIHVSLAKALSAFLLLVTTLLAQTPHALAQQAPAPAPAAAPPSQELFDLRAAFLLANASEVAYRDPAEIDGLLEKMGVRRELRQVHVLPLMRVFAASIGPFTIIAFRGTETVDDWIKTNANAVLRRTPAGEFHAGFLGAWQEVEDRVRAYLAVVSAANPGRRQRVWIGGHSLGGTVAVIAGIHLRRDEEQDQHYQVAGVVTFGQPRVVGSGAPVLVPKLIRYVFGRDPVPRLPSIGYRDVGELRYDKRFDDLLAAEDDGARRQLVDEYLGRLKQYIPTVGAGSLGGYVPSRADHAVKNYSRLLARHMVVDGDGCSKLMSLWMIDRDKPLPECATEEWLLGAVKN